MMSVSEYAIDVDRSVEEILKEKNIKFFLDLEIHEYRIDDKISYDKEFLIQDPDGYLLRFNN